ncbi:MAG: glycosyltransferase [Woeseiaceae bacterium]
MPSFRGGGAERVMITLAHGFAAHGVAADIVVAQQEGPNLPPPVEGTRIVNLGAHRVLASLAGLARYLRDETPDAMLSALPHANVVSVWARSISRTTTRLVLSEHTVASLSAANARLLRARFLPVFMRRTYRTADAVVAVSDGVADDLAALTGIDRSSITRIYNPVVTPRLAQLAEERLEHSWFSAGQPPVVLGVGRLTPAKDFRTLVRAFAVVRERRPVRLLILGEGEERQRLEALVRTVGIGADVSLPGFVDNPYRYMKQASVFVLSSRWEGFGNVLVEAMACGTPIVSTDCDGPREILQGGRHGKLTAIGDPSALARAIEIQLDEPSNSTVIERAQAFTVDAALDEYRAVLAI